MAQNVFDATLDANNRLDVNAFDWSHLNQLSLPMGAIVPVFTELLPAKSSVRINPEFGLELMPMVFPVQTRMFARLNFFKVPLRTLCSDYMDLVGGFRDDIQEPYILPDKSRFSLMCSTGSLGDYLGLPTQGIKSTTFPKESPTDSLLYAKQPFPAAVLMQAAIANGFYATQQWQATQVQSNYCSLYQSTIDLTRTVTYQNGENTTIELELNTLNLGGDVSYCVTDQPFKLLTGSAASKPKVLVSEHFLNKPNKVARIPITIPFTSELPNKVYITVISVNFFIKDIYYSSRGEVDYEHYPFATEAKPNNQRLLAWRFRAYESIYNSYYRDPRNNPFVIDGKPTYNKWLPSLDSGADKNLYELRYANYERDFLTTSVPNPQQGANAPLAGLSTYDVQTLNDDGTYTVQKRTALVTEDGLKYGLQYKVSEDGTTLESVDYEPLDNKLATQQITSAVQLANSGLSIETLRYVNAYQKYLELNMRKGFGYKQIMEGRFDVNIRFDELMMPEFFGGVSRELSMRTVEQTVDQQSASDTSYSAALGSKTGIAGVYGNSDNNIEVFCDEECIIMGLLCVTPVPTYTQLLAKDWTYNSILDHFQPEFDRIGFQPITYKELCPLACTSQEELNGVFGYQRPWYEYVAKVDTAHGQFRTTMANFLLQRFFVGLPQLGKQFTVINPRDMTDVFAVQEFTDKIFGYVKFNCTARLPISRVAIPRLD